MKLHEILEKIERLEPLSYEDLKPRLKQIRAYFTGFYYSEPILLTWNVTNTGGIHTICPSEEFDEATDQILDKFYPDLNEQEREEQTELISFYSKFIKDIEP